MAVVGSCKGGSTPPRGGGGASVGAGALPPAVGRRGTTCVPPWHP